MKLFVYGTLKPDQPGYRFLRQIEAVESVSETEAAMPHYQLFDWDGLPVAVRLSSPEASAVERVCGYLLEIVTTDENQILVELDSYELGVKSKRYLKRLQVPIVIHGGSEATAWVYVLDDSGEGSRIRQRLRQLPPISGGNWTMANDPLFMRVFPIVYEDAKTLLAVQSDDDGYHVKILGSFLVIYSCLERFGLHLYGPRRYRFKDRVPLQNLLKDDYFKLPKSLSWFEPLNEREVFDSDTMTRRPLTSSPPHFWATIRNNSSHQGKAGIHDHTDLLRVAISSLGDFLALALINLNDSQTGRDRVATSRRRNPNDLRQNWERLGFSPRINALQALVSG